MVVNFVIILDFDHLIKGSQMMQIIWCKRKRKIVYGLLFKMKKII